MLNLQSGSIGLRQVSVSVEEIAYIPGCPVSVIETLLVSAERNLQEKLKIFKKDRRFLA